MVGRREDASSLPMDLQLLSTEQLEHSFWLKQLKTLDAGQSCNLQKCSQRWVNERDWHSQTETASEQVAMTSRAEGIHTSR
jgi:hypothetical protein